MDATEISLISMAMKKMIKARTALILEQRFYGQLATKLNLKEDVSAKTMWTDGVTLGFNTDWVLNQSMDETKAVVVHEVMHCAFGHHCGRGDRDADDYNLACDYAENPIIRECGFKLPPTMADDRFKGQNRYDIYNHIHGKKQKNDNGTDSGKQRNENKPSKTPSEGQTGQGQGNDKGRGTNTSQNGKMDVTAGNDPGRCGEVRDYPGDSGDAPSESELKQEEQYWKIAVSNAANQAKGCGQLPAGLEELIGELLEPKVSWKEALQRFVEQVSKNDYSYKRTNPRYAGYGIIMPSLYNKELNPIDVWIDTSGSMSTDDLKQCFSEIDDIRQHYKTTIRVVLCDTKVNEVVIVEAEDDFKEISCKGRGGTRFAPAIKWSQDEEEHPCCGVYISDMDCDDFGPEPDFPVLWIQTEGPKAKVPFGEVIRMKDRF